jgi:glycosyltransferase involved in cell wall biosynthesis
MKILLDNIIYSKAKNGGVSNYWYHLSKYLINETDNKINFFEQKTDLENFHRNALSIPSQSIIELNPRILLLARLLSIEYNSNERFIYHSSYYRKLSNAKNAVEVSTIHDFTHNYFLPVYKKIIHNNLKFDAIKRSKGVICISKNTYSDLMKFCPTNSNQKLEVIYNGVSDDFFPLKMITSDQDFFLKNNKIQDDYLLFISGRKSYKNFDFVTKIVNENRELKLVIVGGGSLNSSEIKMFSKTALKNVIFFDSVTNNELNLLYNRAFALIYPSSYEGFGIPVVEAMRAGCPVIGLDNAVIKEISEKSAVLLKSLDIKDFEAVKKKLFNQDFRTKTIENGFIESKKFSWEKCCRETNEFYKSLY